MIVQFFLIFAYLMYLHGPALPLFNIPVCSSGMNFLPSREHGQYHGVPGSILGESIPVLRLPKAVYAKGSDREVHGRTSRGVL